MMRSMFSAISGLKNHQTFMDVVGNNIANVNTTGFKQSRVTFQDILSQTVRGASGPQGGRGGVNPMQVGLGTLISGIDTIHTQGTLQSTGKSTDMAIQGDGYFVTSDGQQNYYTRDGTFDVGIDNTLVNAASGLRVQGWQADPLTGVIDIAAPPTSITVPLGAGMTGKASTGLTVKGNLDANTAAADTYQMSASVFDAQGNAIPLVVTFTKNAAANSWGVLITEDAAAGATATTNTTTSLTFNGSGKVDTTVAPGGVVPITLAMTAANGATTPQTVELDMTQITQLAAISDLNPSTDGAKAGTLTTFTVGAAGDITGLYSNGFKQPLGQIALDSFANPSGLMKAGGNLFVASANSGAANIGTPDSGGRGTIATGFLEGSNVDL